MNTPLQAAQGSGGSHSAGGSIAGVYFVSHLVMGNFVLLGVLLAIAYKNLGDTMPHAPVRKLSIVEIRSQSYLTVQDKSMPQGISFYVFGASNGFRRFCHRLMWKSWFDPFILACIFASSLLLAAEDFENPNNDRNDVLFYFDVGFTAIFVLELFVKTVALGLVMHARSYLRSGWNVLDFIVVVSSVVSLSLRDAASNIAVVKVIRVVRVLRPLRAVKRSPGMRKVVDAVLASLTRIPSLLAMAFVFILCFALLGVSLFKGRFNYCTDNQMVTAGSCVGEFEVPGSQFIPNSTMVVQREWKQHYLNFNTVAKAGEALCSIVTFEDW